LVGVRDLVKDPTIEEQRLIARAIEEVRNKTRNPKEDPEWLRWFGKSRFRQECREGDSVIYIWRSKRSKRPTVVFRGSPVLLKQSTPKWTRFYLKEPTGSDAKISWGRFKRLLKELGYPKHVGPRTEVLLDSDLADAIARKWKGALKT
jgi:hypothetical protein